MSIIDKKNILILVLQVIQKIVNFVVEQLDKDEN